MPPPIFGTSRCAIDGAEAGGELHPDLLLPVGGEHVDDPVDGLGGVVGVQRREDEVPGLGQGEGELNGLEVTHLTDQQDIGVLTEGRAQRPLERRAVDADLTLVTGRQAVVVDVLDGVLDGEDVQRARLVDASDDGCQGGRLSRAGRAGHQDQATGEPGHPLGHRRQPKLFEVRDVGGDHPERQRHLAPLVERAATKPGPVEPGEREVDVLMLVEDGLLLRGQHALHELGDLGALHRRLRLQRTAACRRA